MRNLLIEARKFALTRLEEEKNKTIKEFSGLTSRIEVIFNRYLDQARRATSQDLKTHRYERNFEKEISQLLLSNQSTVQPPKLPAELPNLDEVIKKAQEAKSIAELNEGIKSLDFYRNSQNPEIKKIYEQRKQEVDNLWSLLGSKLQANQNIEKALGEGYPISEANGDIIPAYQGHAEKIKNFTEKQDVENFAKEMIAYLGEQKAAHQSLSNGLKAAADVADSSKDQEEGIFEKRRQVRKNLDDLSENTSPEAKQAYQVMNKDDKVVNLIKELANKIW